MSASSKPLLVIVTGLSGAGSSTALAGLADNGVHCIDNIPNEMLEDMITMIESKTIQSQAGFALCMDARDDTFAKRLPELRKTLADRVRLDVVFLRADRQVIATRYSATRRRHPMLLDGTTLMEAIEKDTEVLAGVEEAADTVIDTTWLRPQELIDQIVDRYSSELPERTLHLTITSFGFKYGQIRPVDMIYDVRFLRNPHYVGELRERTGLESIVQNYVLEDPLSKEMLSRIDDFNRFLLPNYQNEGKHYFRIGIGCSGGRHRSVTLAEMIGQELLKQPIPNVLTTILHRDIER